MRTSPGRYALLVLVLSARALAASVSEFEEYDAHVQPDVLRVRASASADASILTRLPINHPVRVVGAPTAEGFVEVRVRNQEVITPSDQDEVKGFVRADMLGKRQTEKMLEDQLGSARSPQEQWMWLERLMALRGSEADKERMRTLAQESGNKEWLAHAKRLEEPPPTVMGVCFQGRVSILAQLVGNKLEPLVESHDNTTRDSPEVRASEARLRARALELTTLRFSLFRPGMLDTGYLVQPRVVTEVDVTETARTRIELGPCPQLRGEVSVFNAHVFVSAPLKREQDATFSGAELARYVARLPSPVHELRVFTPPGRFIELNISGGVYLFEKGKPEVWACGSDACMRRRLTSTQAPVWLQLTSGQQVRIGSQTEDVDNTGWGTPANSGLWVSPDFVIHVFDGNGGLVEGRVSLNQYGC
ncbi:hypothetical protein ATI61_109338 [Archangium gephyra]|uniref:SH3 domain-containing protein n=1 Tax=Archangium gephyra TaxID=48 RepID=A0AAC8TCK2_9BACT|nr:SH3 domain-containing protein [Archangium gephyra]AKI99460.1 Hypothetical protein AA314_01087 [Archangium gephyra]REG27996.1 hypothetical protein ATI61_109338 [Archangium gephyra]